MVLKTIKRYYNATIDWLEEKTWLRERPIDRSPTREGCWADRETEELATEYEKVLDRYARENPNGIRLYDDKTLYEKPEMIREKDG